jgi:two-component system, chemotaxis family, CheB/CheR fusion protein
MASTDRIDDDVTRADGGGQEPTEGPVPARPRPFNLVGVGASAGGLKALKAFFEAVPADSGLSYVVIVHLDPDHASHMADLLQTRAKIPISQVAATFTPEPNQAYVIPPNRNLSVTQGGVELAVRNHHAPIDLFFRTLAQAYGAQAVGVVLSGTGSDGTAGVRWIHEAGGVTMAQTPAEAEYDAMPKGAIASGYVDLVLPVAEMPARLMELMGTHPRVPRIADTDRDPLTGHLGRIIRCLRRRKGHDFGGYKPTTLLRRVERRMRFRRIESIAAYAQLLEVEGEEVDRLFRDLMISVSSFFRDSEAFEALAREVVPKLFERKGSRDQVRVWVAGCATGEEAYTLAILLAEHADTLSSPPQIQIFATDIDERACRYGRAGVYPQTIAAQVSPERIQRFFDVDGPGYRVKESLRARLLFASHDLLRDPPFSRLDLVSCRNVLIYLAPQAQKDLLRTLHYALLPDGHLFLGSSEQPADEGLFVAVDSRSRIYSRVTTPYQLLPKRDGGALGGYDVQAVAASRDDRASRVHPFPYGALHLRMLEAYAPPSLIVDDTATVVHLTERAGRYVRLSGGVPKSNLFDLVSGDLRMELRAALHTAIDQGGVVRRSVRTEIDGEHVVLDMSVSPLRVEGERAHALIVFGERQDTDSADEPVAVAEPTAGIVERLEQELRRAREQLGITLEERDITVEELRSANEELQSINEQHRTALEEMETSQEELQSLNEELTTINQEHHATIEELRDTTADLTNLVSSINVATIFLDRELCVRRFSPLVTTMFSLTPPDQGRPLAHLSHRLKYDTLIEDAAKVLSAIEPIEREVADDSGHWYNVRMRPYMSGDNRIDGVVVTLYDVTDTHRQRQSEQDARTLAEAESARLRALMQQIPAGVLIVDVPSGRVATANERAFEIWGEGGLPLVPTSGVNGPGIVALRPDGTAYSAEEWPIARLSRTGRRLRDEEVEFVFADGRRLVLLVNAVPVVVRGRQGGDETHGAIVTFLDITARRRMERELREAMREAEDANRTKGLFMATLSHEFRTPLNGILGYADLLAQDQRLDEQQRRKVDRIQAAVRHLSAMTEEVLGLAGLEANQEVSTPAARDVREAAAEAVQMCEPVATAAGLTLGLEMPDEAVLATTDHNRVRMILVNLIGNAMKFTERGTVRVELRGDGDRVTIDVHDTGMGIAPENHELVFERFWQVSQGLTRSAGGMGIGLFAARQFSHLLGGDIEVRSALGRGSVFSLWLPRVMPVSKA